MTAKLRRIEIDADTADALEKRAAARGLSVSELLTEFVAPEDDLLDELDRRFAPIAAGRETIAHDDVERWLKTWGSAAFKPWTQP